MHISFEALIKYTGYNINDLKKNLVNIFKYGTPENLSHLQCDSCLCDRHSEPEISNIEVLEDNFYRLTFRLPSCLGGYKSGLPMLLNSISYLSVFSDIERYSIVKLDLPEHILSEYQGPRVGLTGIRKVVNVPKRALLGLIIKPRTKLNLSLIDDILGRTSDSNIDYIIDDELVVTPCCADFEKRLDIYGKYGNSKLFFVNATADINTSLKIIKEALNRNVRGIVLNAITMGLPAIKYIIDQFNGEPIFIVNNVGRGILTRHEEFGISESVYAYLTRLVGADAVYTGPLTKDFIYSDTTLKEEVEQLQKNSLHIKQSFAVASGGINFSNVLHNTRTMGTDLMLQMGTGFLSGPNDIQSKISLCNGILESLSFINNDDEYILENLKSIFESKTKANNNMSMEKQYIERVNQLKDNLSNDYELLKEYEDSLRYENDPKNKVKYKREIKTIRTSITNNYIELEQITSSEEIMVGQDYYDIRKFIAEELSISYFAEIKDKLASDITTLLDNLNEQAKMKLPHEVNEQVSKVISEPVLDNKLKLSIPIIPLLLNYETELKLSVSPYKLWKKMLKVFNK